MLVCYPAALHHPLLSSFVACFVAQTRESLKKKFGGKCKNRFFFNLDTCILFIFFVTCLVGMDSEGVGIPAMPPTPAAATPVVPAPATHDDFLCMKRAKHRQFLKLTSKICSNYELQG